MDLTELLQGLNSKQLSCLLSPPVSSLGTPHRLIHIFVPCSRESLCNNYPGLSVQKFNDILQAQSPHG